MAISTRWTSFNRRYTYLSTFRIRNARFNWVQQSTQTYSAFVHGVHCFFVSICFYASRRCRYGNQFGLPDYSTPLPSFITSAVLFVRPSPSSAFISYLYDNATVDRCNRGFFQLIMATVCVVKAPQKKVDECRKAKAQHAVIGENESFTSMRYGTPCQPMLTHPCRP